MANAEFIALACNSHYTLVDALARLTDASTVLTNLKQSNFAIRADVWDEMYAANKAAQVALAELGNCAKRTPVATKSLRVG
jgi:ribosomal protein L2